MAGIWTVGECRGRRGSRFPGAPDRHGAHFPRVIYLEYAHGTRRDSCIFYKNGTVPKTEREFPVGIISSARLVRLEHSASQFGGGLIHAQRMGVRGLLPFSTPRTSLPVTPDWAVEVSINW